MATYYVDGNLGADGNAGTSPGAGNAWATIGKAAGVAVAGDTVYILDSATYTFTSSVTFSTSGSTSSGAIIFEGYHTTPGAQDGRPTITSSSSGLNLFNLSAVSFLVFRSLKITHTGASRGNAFTGTTSNSSFVRIENCIIDGCARAFDGGSRPSDPLTIHATEIINCTDGTGAVVQDTASTYLDDCYFKSNAGAGMCVLGTSRLYVNRCIFGSNNRGIYDAASSRTQSHVIISSTFANNVNDGVRIDALNASGGYVALWWENNISYGNGGYGLNLQNGQVENDARQVVNRNNAYGANTSGARNHLSAGTSDVTLATDPFTSASAGDYSLNATAGGGALVRAAGYPGAFPGVLTVGYIDIGATQHQDSGGGGTTTLLGF